jgi:hypothetical protein
MSVSRTLLAEHAVNKTAFANDGRDGIAREQQDWLETLIALPFD